MYNRYIRNDNGVYTRVPQEEPVSGKESPTPENKHIHHKEKQPPPPPAAPPPQSSGISQITDSLTGFLRHALDQLHLDHVDTGDLLLLALLFLLFREDADEELLIALGLLLIL